MGGQLDGIGYTFCGTVSIALNKAPRNLPTERPARGPNVSILSNNHPPAPRLSRRGAWYVCSADDRPALLDLLRRHPDLHEWAPRAEDTRRSRERSGGTRFYHKPAGQLRRVEAAGIVVDRPTPAGVWIRLDGPAAERCRPILDALVVVEPAQVEQPAPPAAEQMSLFAAAGGQR